jgi:hypothetical protein
MAETCPPGHARWQAQSRLVPPLQAPQPGPAHGVSWSGTGRFHRIRACRPVGLSRWGAPGMVGVDQARPDLPLHSAAGRNGTMAGLVGSPSPVEAGTVLATVKDAARLLRPWRAAARLWVCGQPPTGEPCDLAVFDRGLSTNPQAHHQQGQAFDSLLDQVEKQMVESDFLARPPKSRLTGKPSYEPGHDGVGPGVTMTPAVRVSRCKNPRMLRLDLEDRARSRQR